MKGLFVNCKEYNDENDLKTCGVMKKVYSQVKVLKKHFEVEHMLINLKGIDGNLFTKIWRRLPFTAVGAKWKYNEKFANLDFIYFRKSEIDYPTIKLLKTVKKKNPNCKIVFEIPTYPFKTEEYTSLKDLPFRIKSNVNCKRLKKCVDRIATFAPDREIFGVKTINTINGLDFDECPLRNVNEDVSEINMIAVASLHKAHGYDRMIKGIGEYYKNGGTRPIKFHIVGSGSVVGEYKNLIKNYGLDDKVILYGRKSGKELDEIYDKSNLGIDCLFLHIKNVKTNSTLKAREYGAKGLPMVSEIQIDCFPKDFPYATYLPKDDSPANVEDVIAFFDGVYNGKSVLEISKEIRETAEKLCSMDVSLKPIIEYIKG